MACAAADRSASLSAVRRASAAMRSSIFVGVGGVSDMPHDMLSAEPAEAQDRSSIIFGERG
jgi:hypothetical protein